MKNLLERAVDIMLQDNNAVVLIFYSFWARNWKKVHGKLEKVETGYMVYAPETSSYYSFQDKLHLISKGIDGKLEIRVYRPNKA
jgi:hypothetical protein